MPGMFFPVNSRSVGTHNRRRFTEFITFIEEPSPAPENEARRRFRKCLTVLIPTGLRRRLAFEHFEKEEEDS